MTPTTLAALAERLDALYKAREGATGDVFAGAHYRFTQLVVEAWPTISRALRVQIPREPTPEMMDAGYRAVGLTHYAPNHNKGWGTDAKDIWRAMHDAAQPETQPSARSTQSKGGDANGPEHTAVPNHNRADAVTGAAHPQNASEQDQSAATPLVGSREPRPSASGFGSGLDTGAGGSAADPFPCPICGKALRVTWRTVTSRAI